uniref:Serpentine receptor class gamma n=1 Tax=Caenorhabditis tropicalis TaxID=1561998 RepID=A0A1I7TH50_9PELO
MLSIRKYLYLASAQLNNPQRYILWQMISIVIIKIINITYLLICQKGLDDMIEKCMMADCQTIPLIIQISYLGCNRRNLQKLIASFKFWNFIRNLFRKRSTVEPINPATDKI